MAYGNVALANMPDASSQYGIVAVEDAQGGYEEESTSLERRFGEAEGALA